MHEGGNNAFLAYKPYSRIMTWGHEIHYMSSLMLLLLVNRAQLVSFGVGGIPSLQAVGVSCSCWRTSYLGRAKNAFFQGGIMCVTLHELLVVIFSGLAAPDGLWTCQFILVIVVDSTRFVRGGCETRSSSTAGDNKRFLSVACALAEFSLPFLSHGENRPPEKMLDCVEYRAAWTEVRTQRSCIRGTECIIQTVRVKTRK